MTHRFYVEDLSAESVALDGQEAHHAAGVLRLKAGAEVELFDGRGGRASAKIVSTGQGQVVVSIVRRHPAAVRHGPQVHLGFAPPKGKRLDWLIEKATELGAASLQAIVFERSIAGREGLSDAKARRWLAHCMAAAKQSGLDFLPQLRPSVSLDEFLAASAGATGLLGDPSDGRSLPSLLAGRGDQPIVLLIGSEGGLAQRERQAATDAGFHAVRLGWTTLRTETAALALLAATMAVCTEDAPRPAN